MAAQITQMWLAIIEITSEHPATPNGGYTRCCLGFTQLLAAIAEVAPGPRVAVCVEGTRGYGLRLARAHLAGGPPGDHRGRHRPMVQVVPLISPLSAGAGFQT
jgi:hypothetical protein